MRRIKHYMTISAKRCLNPEPHCLKEVFRSEKIPLWKLRNCTGVPESKLSRYLNGIDPMPQDLQRDLFRLSYMLTGKIDEYHKMQEHSAEILSKMKNEGKANMSKELSEPLLRPQCKKEDME